MAKKKKEGAKELAYDFVASRRKKKGRNATDARWNTGKGGLEKCLAIRRGEKKGKRGGGLSSFLFNLPSKEKEEAARLWTWPTKGKEKEKHLEPLEH